jgi:hypothetical protein
MTTKAEIDAFMAAAKNTVVPMNWREKLSRKDPQWWEYVSAVEVDGTVVEDTQLVVQWRPSKGAAKEKYNCGIILRGERIYAVDFEPDGQHTNKAGKGRPYHGQRIGPGTHGHTWSDDGEGYAEPMDDFSNLAALFEYFCGKSKLNVTGGYVPPPSVQLSLI